MCAAVISLQGSSSSDSWDVGSSSAGAGGYDGYYDDDDDEDGWSDILVGAGVRECFGVLQTASDVLGIFCCFQQLAVSGIHCHVH